MIISLILSASGALFSVSPLNGANVPASIRAITPAAVYASVGVLEKPLAVIPPPAHVPVVPFYSQFHNITDIEWQKLGCGIADLAMLIEFYKPGSVSVDVLLQEGIAAGAFQNGAGWKHRDLAFLAQTYGLDGTNYDFSHLDTETAFAQFETILKEGPVIASVYYKFEVGNKIPHLAVINGILGDTVYYNDPSSGRGGESISVSDFKKAWKKRLIAVRL